MAVPTVTTIGAIDNTQTSFTLQGNVTAGGVIIKRGFQYGLATGDYDWLTEETGTFGTGAYSLPVTDLWAGKLYYFRAYADNAEGRGYGSEQSALTLFGSPFSELEPSDDDALIYNQCDIKGDAIGTVSCADDVVQLTQGKRILTQNNSPLNSAIDAMVRAYINVQRLKESITRVKSILLIPDSDPTDLLPKALGYEISTRIRLQVNGTRNPAYLDQAYHIEGIEHEWNISDDQWRTHFQLWDINEYKVFPLLHEGYLRHFGTTSWVEILDAADATTPAHNDEGSVLVGSKMVLSAYYCHRGLLEFNTTGLLTTEDVVGAAIVFACQAPINNTFPFNVHIVPAGSVGNPLVLSDYGLMHNLSPSYGYTTIPAGALSAALVIIELNASGLLGITKEGTTGFVLRSNYDIDETDMPGSQPKYGYIDIDGLGEVLEPRLIVRTK